MKIFPCLKVKGKALLYHIHSGVVGYHVDRSNGYREINLRILGRASMLNEIEVANEWLTDAYKKFINNNPVKTTKPIDLTIE